MSNDTLKQLIKDAAKRGEQETVVALMNAVDKNTRTELTDQFREEAHGDMNERVKSQRKGSYNQNYSYGFEKGRGGAAYELLEIVKNYKGVGHDSEEFTALKGQIRGYYDDAKKRKSLWWKGAG